MDGMESSQYEYLRVNKYFLRVIGQWPYQSTLEKILIGIVFIPIIALQTILQGGGMITALNVGDVDTFMESFAPFMISWMCLAKFANFIFNGGQMKNLLNMMRDDWKMFSVSSNELDILSRHYGVGKKITFNYAAFLYGTMTPFMIVPSLQIMADAVGFYNLSGERPLMFRVEHFVDVEKYYYFVLIHSYLGTLAFITVVVACDSMIEGSLSVQLVINVVYRFKKHNESLSPAFCLLYAALYGSVYICSKYIGRLKNFMDGDTDDIELYPTKQEDKSYQNTRTCVILHKHIIEFGKTIEDANTVALFFQLGFNLVGVSFTQFQAVANLATPNKSFRFGSFTICLLSILFLDSWRGQQMLDSTDRIFEYTTSGNWYYSSLNSRKLLSVMLSKSIRPIKVTAGKLYILNLENFTSILRTSFSYCMVLCSFQ